MSFPRNALRVLDALLGAPLIHLARRRAGGVVLLYHRVSAEDGPDSPPLHPEVFREHLDLLTGLFNVLPLEEFVARLAVRKSLRGCCALTFDDGYADFLTGALPALETKGLPATHFLVVDSVLTGRPPWNARLARLFRLDTSPPKEPRSQVLDRLSRMPWVDRDASLSEWEDRVEDQGDLPPRMIGTNALAQLLNANVDVGAHTLSHCFLSRVAPHEAERELRNSRLELERLCGARVRFTSYPQGLYGPAIESMAQKSGFIAGFAVEQRRVRPGTRPYAIPRFDVTDRPTWMLRMELSGFIPWLRTLRRT